MTLRQINPESGAVLAEAPRTVQERGAVAERLGGRAYWEQGEAEQEKVRLWDAVDHTWTGWLPRELAFNHYLRKVVSACSSCAFASLFEVEVPKHISSVLEHRFAKLIPVREGNESRVVCSACGPGLRLHEITGAEHLAHMQQLAPGHSKAQVQTMFHYLLAPSATGVVLPSDGRAANGSESDRQAGSQWAGRRRRARSRSRRG